MTLHKITINYNYEIIQNAYKKDVNNSENKTPTIINHIYDYSYDTIDEDIVNDYIQLIDYINNLILDKHKNDIIKFQEQCHDHDVDKPIVIINAINKF
jgi:hypothetical protein